MNEKPISCGFIILNNKNEILACHPTGAAEVEKIQIRGLQVK